MEQKERSEMDVLRAMNLLKRVEAQAFTFPAHHSTTFTSFSRLGNNLPVIENFTLCDLLIEKEVF